MAFSAVALAMTAPFSSVAEQAVLSAAGAAASLVAASLAGAASLAALASAAALVPLPEITFMQAVLSSLMRLNSAALQVTLAASAAWSGHLSLYLARKLCVFTQASALALSTSACASALFSGGMSPAAAVPVARSSAAT